VSNPINTNNGRMRKIMLADDDAKLRRAVRAQLEAAGFEVLEATDGIRALDRLREDVDAVVVDSKIPGSAGLDVLRDVRARFPDTPVILLSGGGSVPEAMEAMRFGAAKYLSKPFHPEEVLTAVRQTLRAADLDGTSALENDETETQSTGCEEVAERPNLAGFTMEQIECWALMDALEAVGGNKAAAARMLGVCEKTIYNKLKRMRLQGRHE